MRLVAHRPLGPPAAIQVVALSEGGRMSLEIEISDMCSGHGRCYVLEPGLFEPDDDGFGTIIQKVVSDPADCAAAQRAATACPEGAILLTEVG